jgi:thioredoxin 1
MDVDESPDIVMKYQVMSVPTVILFKDGQPLERLSGYQPKDKLVGKINPHLG